MVASHMKCFAGFEQGLCLILGKSYSLNDGTKNNVFDQIYEDRVYLLSKHSAEGP